MTVQIGAGVAIQKEGKLHYTGELALQEARFDYTLNFRYPLIETLFAHKWVAGLKEGLIDFRVYVDNEKLCLEEGEKVFLLGFIQDALNHSYSSSVECPCINLSSCAVSNKQLEFISKYSLQPGTCLESHVASSS